jgi:hypothetical protein
VLYPGDLVAGCTLVFSELGFNDNLRVELIGYNKIRRLVETCQAFGTFGLAEDRMMGVLNYGAE